LNGIFVRNALLLAAVLGVVFQSGLVFLVALIAGLAWMVKHHEIRLRGGRPRRDQHRDER